MNKLCDFNNMNNECVQNPKTIIRNKPCWNVIKNDFFDVKLFF